MWTDIQVPRSRWRFVSPQLVALLLAWLVAGLPLAAATPPTNNSQGLPTLTRVEQVRRMTPEQANLGYPVRIQGTVTYYGGFGWELFVQDSSGGVYVEAEAQHLDLKAGQLVEVEGYTSSGGYSPDILDPHVRVVGESALPLAPRFLMRDLIAGAQDSQWIEIDGIIRAVHQDTNQLVLDVASDGRFKVRLPLYPPNADQLVDAKVRMRGVCGSVFNQKHQIIGVEMYVPSLAEIEILDAPPTDPFALPKQRIRTLLQFTPRAASTHRVRVGGVVTLQRLGRSLYIKDDVDGLALETNQMAEVHPGDVVEAVGFPGVGKYTPVLENAIFRRIAGGSPPQAEPATVAQALQGIFDSELVSLEARLIDRKLLGGEPVLILGSGSHIFDANVQGAENDQRLAHLKTGSRLRLTGICTVEVDENRVPRGFSLLLRSPRDILVLQQPPWLTARHLLTIVAILAGAIWGTLIWVTMLRRRVNKQTVTIRGWLQKEVVLKKRYQELFENANDFVFTLDLNGRFTSLNKAGERLSGYSLAEARKMTTAQMAAPEYVSVVQKQLARAMNGESLPAMEIELATRYGRRLWIETSLRPIREGEKIIGLQAIARDFTERRRAQEELRKLSQAVEQSPACVVITDPLGNIEYVNPRFEKLAGYSLADVTGKNPRILKSGLTQPEVYQQLWATITAGGDWHGELLNKKKNGELYWESASISPVRNEAGETTHYLAVKEDISDRKRAERVRAAEYRIAELANSTHRLEDFYRSTHELVNTLMPAKNFYIALYDAAADVLSFSYYVDEQDEAPPPRRPRKGFTEYILRTGKPLLAPPEVLQELVKAGEIESRGTQPHDRVGVPLRLSGEPIGVLVVQSYSGGIRYGEEEKNALQFISEQVAMAVSRKRAEEERHFLQIVTQAIGASEDLTSGLRATVQALCKASGWVLGQVWIPCADGTHLEVTPAWYGNAPGSQEFRTASEGLALLPGEGVPGRAWSTRQRVWLQEGLFEDVSARRSAASALGLKLGVAIPVLSEGKVLAVMEFLATKARAQDQGLLEVIASVGGQLGTLMLRKRAEQALRSSEEKFRALAETANDAIISADQEGNIIHWNKGAERTFGYTAGELLGMPLTLIMPGGFRDAHRQGMRRHPSTEEAHVVGKTVELGGRRKDGSELPLELSLASWKTGEGTFLTGIIRDITDRKRAEAELRKAKEAAEAATRAKSTFLATMSHEIRTPINGIIGMTELALDTPLNGEQHEYIETVRDSSLHLLHLINDILDFSKIDAGKLEMDLAEFHLRPTLESVLKPLRARAQQKDLRLNLEIEPQAETNLIGDSVRLGQVVLNLVGNAIKFTERGSVTLRVTEAETEHDHTSLQFSVSDTGIGIPADKHQLIFDSFTQADGSTTRKYGGTGLGLAISRRLVEMMGGRIWVESEVGKGSTFHFTARFGLPQPQQDELASEAPAQRAGSLPSEGRLGDERDGTEKDRRKLRILLAEDDRVNELVAVRALEKQGHTVVVAANGVEALAAQDRATFDLILMDVRMPEMDGIEATRAIRDREKMSGGHIPIVAMTAHAMQADKQRCAAAGMDGYLSKPVRIQELYATIENVVQARPRCAAPDGGQNPSPDDANNRLDMTAVDGDAELLAELAVLFLVDCPKRMSAIRAAISRGDASALEVAAHALKGSMSNFTDNGPLETARRLEAMGHDKNLNGAEDALANLEAEMQQFNQTLFDLKKETTP